MSKMSVAKVTLSTKKIVFLREMKISDTEQAAQMVASKSNNNPHVLQLLMQKALLQIVLVQIEDKRLSAIEKEDIDSLFTMAEYAQLLKVIEKMSGGDDLGKEAKIELVAS